MNLALGSGYSRQQIDGGSSGGNCTVQSSSTSCKAVKPLPLQLTTPWSNRRVCAVGSVVAGVGLPAPPPPATATPAAAAANTCSAKNKLSACAAPGTGSKRVAAAVMNEMYGDLLAELGCGSEDGDDMLVVGAAPPAAVAAGAAVAPVLAETAAAAAATPPSDEL
jgi:hypothetical protein